MGGELAAAAAATSLVIVKKKRSQVQRKQPLETGTQATLGSKPAGYVATGYPALDKLLYGGLFPKFAVALTSPPCDERDSLIKSFLETGVKNGEATFYVTINPGFAIDLAERYPSSF